MNASKPETSLSVMEIDICKLYIFYPLRLSDVSDNVFIDVCLSVYMLSNLTPTELFLRCFSALMYYYSISSCGTRMTFDQLTRVNMWVSVFFRNHI